MNPFPLLALGGIALLAASRKDSEVPLSDQTKQSAPMIVGTEAWRRYDALFQEYANSRSIPWEWLKAFSLNESLLGTDPRTRTGAVSSDGLSWGIMQVTLSTAIDLGAGPIQGPALNDPRLSVSLAAKLVRQLADQFPGNLEAIVMSYNEGPGNYRRGKRVPEYWERWKRWMKVIEANP